MKQLKFLDELVTCFEKLPGVGHKTALRYAYYIVEKYSLEDIKKVSDVLIDTFSKIHKCDICGMLTTNDICDICSDNTRDNKKILVIKDPKDLLSIEKTEQYNGKYHVLGGLISMFDGVNPDDLNIEKLEKRVKKDGIEEVIIATSLTPSGDITALFIERLLQDIEGVKVSRIGYGLPAGSDLEYADELTIKRALDYRITKNK
jgi:recombination protein RecR